MLHQVSRHRMGSLGRIKCLIISLLSVSISSSLAKHNKIGLTTTELNERYGQANTKFNDDRSCYRECDGKRRTCYYEFNVQMYDTMSGLCENCENGTISDCFRNGCLTANGVERTIMSINQQLPGPSINVCKDDRIIVDIKNHMPGQELSFHWHGLHQKESPWFDGVPMVTQCPIFSGNSFRYTFNVREAGSHLYHAHSGLHRSNGLIGNLIVREPNEPNADYYDYDLNEHEILLSDWNNELAEEKAPGTRNDAQLPDSILINGFGNYFNSETGQITYAPIAVFYVERGKKHRIRIVNGASHICPLEISVKNHNLTVIATDGYSIEPIVVDSLVSSPGERFDIVLDAVNDLDQNETLLTVRGLEACRDFFTQEFARIIFVDDIHNYSTKIENHEPFHQRPDYATLNIPKITLNYPHTDCTKPGNYCVAALQQKQVPSSVGGNLREEPAEVIPFTFEMVFIQDRPTNYITFFDTAMVTTINYIASKHSPVPGLIQDDSFVPYCNANNLPSKCDRNSVCHCPHAIQLELCKTYEFVLIDDEGASEYINHPIHLHGMAFQVIDMGTREQYESGQTAFANATHLPVVKDTVTLPSGGFLRIRFKACNPGYWLFHCHLEYHMDPGMMAILIVGNRTDTLSPPAHFPTCGNFLTPIYDD